MKILALVGLLMVACGKGDHRSAASVVNDKEQSIYLESEAALPECTDAIRDQLVYIADIKLFKVCGTDGWATVSIQGELGKDGKDALAGANGIDGKNGSDGINGINAATSLGMPVQEVLGTSLRAASNIKYEVNNSSLVTIFLPPNPAINDIIQVVGVGVGGWKILANTGQHLNLAQVLPLPWTEQGVDPNSRIFEVHFSVVVSSIDGIKVVAQTPAGTIYTSGDSGVTWTLRSNYNFGLFSALAASADGLKLVGALFGGAIYVSTDSGVNWTNAGGTPRNWNAIASSSDGVKLVATVFNGQIFTSGDSGFTWVARDINRGWKSITSSSDGVRLAATVNDNSSYYTSTDSGQTWIENTGYIFYNVASSANGIKLVATADGQRIYTSVDSGTTWTPRELRRNWQTVASSADGIKLAATTNDGLIYLSMDSGITWNKASNRALGTTVSMSGDGSKIVSLSGSVPINSFDVSKITTDRSIVGPRNSAIKLVYMGNDTFVASSDDGAELKVQ
jgi:photosystem II stability/assembly factor-like uncharacterized protein